MPALDWKSPFRALFFAFAGVIAASILAACSPSTTNADPALAALIQRIGHYEIGHSPEQADALGLSREAFGRPYGGLLNDRSMAVAERTRAMRLDFLRDLEEIDRASLTRNAQRTYDSTLALMRASVAVEAHGYGYTSLGWTSPYLITFADGAYTDLVKFMTLHTPVRSRADAEAWLTRLDHMDDSMRDERRRFEVDIGAGAVPPKAILQRTLDRVRRLTPTIPREHPLVVYFTESLAQIPDIPEDDISKFITRAAEQVGGPVKEEYVALAKLLESTMANAPDEPGVWKIKDGEGYYRDALKLYTSTDLSPQQLHDAGLKLIDQINAQIEPLLAEMGQVEGSVGGRLRTLSIDPAYLFPETPEGRAALMDALRERIKWAETAMGRMILLGPRSKVEVREAPQVSQQSAPGGYYKPVPLDGSRPATFNINLRSTLDFPSWTLPTLAFHEAVPGHHIQAGLARERPDQPLLNYLVSWPAFSEGWGVYAEDLADELGAYQTDRMAKLGYLQSLLFRAARLVVDTGIHSQKWSRADAIAYLENTTGMSRSDVEFEIDRYIIWPGQACAYMAGRETIRRLRASAQQQLKTRFDVKAFHQAILGPGPRPLPVLEADIADWVQSLRRPQPAKQ
jgi:uncharacterized protein (DUF885 family)